MATRVASNKEGDGNSNKEGNGDQRRHHGQWPRRGGWRAFNGRDSGDGDGDRANDMVACATTGEREMMVVMCHGLCVCVCVCGETTKK